MREKVKLLVNRFRALHRTYGCKHQQNAGRFVQYLAAYVNFVPTEGTKVPRLRCSSFADSTTNCGLKTLLDSFYRGFRFFVIKHTEFCKRIVRFLEYPIRTYVPRLFIVKLGRLKSNHPTYLSYRLSK